jgi:hypothetical protein
MVDKIDQVLNRSIKSLVFKTNRDWGSMVTELAELVGREKVKWGKRMLLEVNASIKKYINRLDLKDKEIAELKAQIAKEKPW